MPHYEDGTEAKIGDEVSCEKSYIPIRHGVVLAIQVGAETCNLTLAHMSVKRPYQNQDALLVSTDFACVTAKECRKIPEPAK